MKGMKLFLCGCLFTILILSPTLIFAETTNTIDAVFGRIKLIVNGSALGEETLLYDGTTYVPLRAVSEILDKEVSYDPSTKTAYIDEKGAGRQFESLKTADVAQAIPRVEILLLPDLLKYSGADYIMARQSSIAMENTIIADDMVIFDKTAYKSEKPKRFDVVAFMFSGDDDTIHVKRIIGLPGETLEIVEGLVYIDGEEEPLDEPYVKDDPIKGGYFGPYEIPDNQYFVIGDNRLNSNDSRFREDRYIKLERILGKLIIISKQ